MKFFTNAKKVLITVSALTVIISAFLCSCSGNTKQQQNKPQDNTDVTTAVESTESTSDDKESTDALQPESTKPEYIQAAQDSIRAEQESAKAEQENANAEQEIEQESTEITDGEADVIEVQQATVLGDDSLSKAIAVCFDKTPEQVTKDELLSVRYCAFSSSDDGSYYIDLGFDSFIDIYYTNAAFEDMNSLLVSATVENIENADTSVLGLMENIICFEFYNVPMADISFITNYRHLATGYFLNNGITDISCLADFRPQSLTELDFTDNEISDWSYVTDIADRIITDYSVQDLVDADGNPVQYAFTTYLSDVLNKDDTDNSQQAESTDNEIFNSDDIGALFQ